jgi:hypothetical protein
VDDTPGAVSLMPAPVFDGRIIPDAGVRGVVVPDSAGITLQFAMPRSGIIPGWSCGL